MCNPTGRTRTTRAATRPTDHAERRSPLDGRGAPVRHAGLECRVGAHVAGARRNAPGGLGRVAAVRAGALRGLR
jgi:hypothetical protein